MARTYAEAVRNGTAAASKLLRRLDWQAKLEAEPGAVDIFAIIAELDLPLMLRPLKGLLGAFLKVPTPGILVTTQRPLSIQRFTAAHELGRPRSSRISLSPSGAATARRNPCRRRGRPDRFSPLASAPRFYAGS